MKYNPSDVGVAGSIFGYPYSESEAELILLPIPWDVTVSYGSGTSEGPQAILDASPQLDLSLHHVAEPWTYPCYMADASHYALETNKNIRKSAIEVIESLEAGEQPNPTALEKVNSACEQLVEEVYQSSIAYLSKGKVVGLVGGDHSTPLGLIKALAEQHEFGILQLDAHMDLRNSYEGFTYSHASIMYNALQLEGVKSLSQVGIRDFCEEELMYASQSTKPIYTYFDDQVKEGLMVGESWSDWVHNIVAHLPQKVYISFDIDGLQPNLCPNTGTPVPGGLSFAEVNYLLKKVVSSGKKIIGFDLNEVSPGSGDWDANVGARILYRLVTMTGLSHGKLKAIL